MYIIRRKIAFTGRDEKRTVELMENWPNNSKQAVDYNHRGENETFRRIIILDMRKSVFGLNGFIYAMEP